MTYEHQQQWNSSFLDPSTSRENVPRQHGLTMIIDKGFGLLQFADLLDTSAAYIDFVKLGFGTSVLYPATVLEEKIKQAKEKGITIYPGGTFFEVAFTQGKMEEYYTDLLHWGFETVEISDGSITLSRQERDQAISLAQQMGLKVITECGKKESGSSIELVDIEDTLYRDMEMGATYMIVEGRESGENVGIYDSQGNLDHSFLETLKTMLGSSAKSLIWEAPHKKQQTELIDHFGVQVNLGNIAPQDIYSLEALRRGLRADTFYLNHKELLK